MGLNQVREGLKWLGKAECILFLLNTFDLRSGSSDLLAQSPTKSREHHVIKGFWYALKR